MATLYDRLKGYPDGQPDVSVDNKIWVATFASLLDQRARDKITNTEAQAEIERNSGAPLDAAQAAEATQLINKITGIGNRALRLEYTMQVRTVLELAEGKAVPYNTNAKIRTMLELPAS